MMKAVKLWAGIKMTEKSETGPRQVHEQLIEDHTRGMGMTSSAVSARGGGTIPQTTSFHPFMFVCGGGKASC